MPRVFCIANQKGGVGKTTTAISLSSCLAKAGSRTLIIDLDPQCNATSGMGQQPVARHPLISEEPLRNCIVEIAPQLFLAPGSKTFHDVDSIVSKHQSNGAMLQTHLATGLGSFDNVFIDCPPSMGQLTQIALAASNEVLMPIQCEYFAMEGLTQMIHVIRRVMRTKPGKLEFGGILLTMYDHRLELTSEVDAEVRDFFGEIVFDTVIPRDVAVCEAPSHGVSVVEYAPRSRGARSYLELSMEVTERV